MAAGARRAAPPVDELSVRSFALAVAVAAVVTTIAAAANVFVANAAPSDLPDAPANRPAPVLVAGGAPAAWCTRASSPAATRGARGGTRSFRPASRAQVVAANSAHDGQSRRCARTRNDLSTRLSW